MVFAEEFAVTAKNLVLRTVYIDPDVDDALRNEAFEGRTSKNDLIRKYLKLGMERATEEARLALAKTRAKPAAKAAGVPLTAKAALKGSTAKATVSARPIRASTAEKKVVTKTSTRATKA